MRRPIIITSIIGDHEVLEKLDAEPEKKPDVVQDYVCALAKMNRKQRRASVAKYKREQSSKKGKR